MDSLRATSATALATIALLAIGLAGCSSTAERDDAAAPTPTTSSTTTTTLAWAAEPLGISATNAPSGLGDEVDFYQDVRCGDAERNVVDVALPPRSEPVPVGDPDDPVSGAGAPGTPLVVHLHGGGFTGGDKAGVWDADETGTVAELLDRGVAVASMNYSLLAETDPDGVLKPLTDVARCLQFIRHHGPATFGIDPERIALRGSSAGAGTALWLAVHDDLAEPDAEDPIRRRSTKPVAVAAHETQATYDLVRWSTDVFGDHPELFGERNLIELAEAFGLSQRLLSFYGVTDSSLLDSPEIVAYRRDVDLLGLMDPDDPPAWIANVREADTAPVSIGLLFHHAGHARALERQARAVGYDAVVTAGPGLEPSVGELEFLLAALDHD